MKTLLTLFLLAAFAVTSSAQKFSHNIKDVWRCYGALKDTVEKGEGGLYVVFGDTSMILFSTMGGTFCHLEMRQNISSKMIR